MSQTARYQETLRMLATIDEGFVEDEAGLGLACQSKKIRKWENACQRTLSGTRRTSKQPNRISMRTCRS
jgi:hypothetical protein